MAGCLASSQAACATHDEGAIHEASNKWLSWFVLQVASNISMGHAQEQGHLRILAKITHLASSDFTTRKQCGKRKIRLRKAATKALALHRSRLLTFECCKLGILGMDTHNFAAFRVEFYCLCNKHEVHELGTPRIRKNAKHLPTKASNHLQTSVRVAMENVTPPKSHHRFKGKVRVGRPSANGSYAGRPARSGSFEPQNPDQPDPNPTGLNLRVVREMDAFPDSKADSNPSSCNLCRNLKQEKPPK